MFLVASLGVFLRLLRFAPIGVISVRVCVVVLGFDMSCTHPKSAWVDDTSSPRRIHFNLPAEWLALNRVPPGWHSVVIPCGKCYSCLKSRALDITVRAVAESRMHDFASFITLTVDDDWLPKVFPTGLSHRPWQLFAKRLRKQIGSFRFLMCGEYGGQTLRPHYHAIVYGHRFIDSSIRDDGSFLPSRALAQAWPFGNVRVDDINDNRIAYVAGYTLKDFHLGRDNLFWDAEGLGRPYVRWSRRPALGLSWFTRHWRELLRSNDGGLTFYLGDRPIHFSSRYFSDKLRFTHPAAFSTLSFVGETENPDAVTCIMRHQEAVNREKVQIHNQKRKVYEL